MVFLKEFFEKVGFEKKQQTTKKHEKIHRGQIINLSSLYPVSYDVVGLSSIISIESDCL